MLQKIYSIIRVLLPAADRTAPSPEALSLRDWADLPTHHPLRDCGCAR